MTGESRYFLDLSTCTSIDDLKSSISAHIINHPDLEWIQGVNWDQSKLGRYPTRCDIDAVCNHKPVFLWRACWHIGVANTPALVRAGIDLTCLTRVVEGGSIGVEGDSLNGILRERAVELITAVMTKKSVEQERRFIIDGLNTCLSYGLTSVQTNDAGCYNVYKSLRDENQLKLRVFFTPNHSEISADMREVEAMNIMAHGGAEFNSPLSFLAADRVKIFSDGSLGAETAAIRTQLPYNHQVSNIDVASDSSFKGILVQPTDSLIEMISSAKAKGYRLEIHAIGDAAAEQVLTAYEACSIKPSDRAIITHCQVLGPDLIDRMEQSGIIANVQPSFVPTDMRWVAERISSQQQQYSYAWKTLLKHKLHVAGGSDAPIETSSPFIGMYDAIYRKERGPGSEHVYRPEECLSFSEALWIYTMGAAYAAGCDHVLGSIAIGYAADMVLVDPSIVHNPQLLQSSHPWMVIVGGHVSYTHENFQRDAANLSTEPRAELCLQGPFIPGKGGRAGGLRTTFDWSQCSCVLLGRNCKMRLRSTLP
jgi:predicted amidohydrolase YtcJ